MVSLLNQTYTAPTAATGAVILAPWMVSLYQSSGTFFYPLLGQGTFGGQYTGGFSDVRGAFDPLALDYVQALVRLGIEISPLAVEDFFAENNLHYQVTDHDGTRLYSSNNLNIYCTDFLTVELRHIPHIDAVYDRASLIALPQKMRAAYVDHLTGLITGGTRSLLVTLDYPQQEMSGPPFSVTPDEVEQLYGTRYSIDHLHSEDCLMNEPHFKDKGLTRLDEHVFLLQKNPE